MAYNKWGLPITKNNLIQPANTNVVGNQRAANPPANTNVVGNQRAANPPANTNVVGNQWAANPPANLNLAMKEALMDAGVGTGGQGGPYVAMKPEMLQGGSYQEGISGDLHPGFGGYQEGISGDLHPGFGMTPQPATSPRLPVQWGGHPSAGVTYPSLPKLNLKEAVKASPDKGDWADKVIDWKGHPSAGVTYPKPKVNWEGHPSAGVTYPDVVGGPESIDTRIKDALAFEDFGSSEVFPTEDMGKWYEPGIPEGDIRAMMALEKGYEQPQNIDTTLTASQLDAIRNPALQAPSVFDEPLDNGGTFAESNFVGPGDYAYGNIQDSSSTLDPRVLAGLNQQAIGHMTDPSGIAGYAAGLPQPEEAPKGVVDPRHMKDYYEMISQTSRLPAGASNMEPIFTGPQGVAPVDETVDLSRDVVRQPWSHPSAGVTYPNYKKEERDSQLNLLKFYETSGMGDTQNAIDLRRTLGLN
jgi:hypothetical protein